MGPKAPITRHRSGGHIEAGRMERRLRIAVRRPEIPVKMPKRRTDASATRNCRQPDRGRYGRTGQPLGVDLPRFPPAQQPPSAPNLSGDTTENARTSGRLLRAAVSYGQVVEMTLSSTVRGHPWLWVDAGAHVAFIILLCLLWARQRGAADDCTNNKIRCSDARGRATIRITSQTPA